MFLMENLNERIQNILTLKNLTLKKSASILGTKISDLKNFSEDTIPDIQFLFALVEYFHVRPDYILTGREPVFMTEEEVKELDIEQSFY